MEGLRGAAAAAAAAVTAARAAMGARGATGTGASSGGAAAGARAGAGVGAEAGGAGAGVQKLAASPPLLLLADVGSSAANAALAAAFQVSSTPAFQIYQDMKVRGRWRGYQGRVCRVVGVSCPGCCHESQQHACVSDLPGHEVQGKGEHRWGSGMHRRFVQAVGSSAADAALAAALPSQQHAAACNQPLSTTHASPNATPLLPTAPDDHVLPGLIVA